MNEVYIQQFKSIRPKYRVDQDQLLAWIVKSHHAAETSTSKLEKLDLATIEKLVHRYGVKPALIRARYTECDDIMSTDFEKNKIYNIQTNQSEGANIFERAQFYSIKASDVFQKIYNEVNTEDKPDHIIHVTCTGYVSPSAAQKIVAKADWKRKTDITHAYHMGCYAALPALRIAKSMVMAESGNQLGEFKADIVHTEMCSLHMNPALHTPEQIVVQTLFADGHIKYSVSAKKDSVGKNLKVLSVLEKVIPDSEKDMSWVPSPWGLQMNLSREVPNKIKAELKSFANELFEKANLPISAGLKSIYAIHPGGPKIIDSVQQTLELSEEQVTESRHILMERGNMSSATLPHVWEKILENKYSSGTYVISFAFGPGLTLFGSVCKIC